ncbi:cytochrome p450 [Neofusicoccum parvum]|uniref:Cytochrome p450 n=1 Tax=Neofusicoccum parvum TaxID=310453 RepID=A0ACB5RUG3_9PEZI|nr:cytochrome p450 [Neofusicoccum parvum]
MILIQFVITVLHAHLAHERHGAVVRLSPTELSYISSDAWNDIYARHDGNAALPKEPAFHAAPPDAPRGLVLAIDGPSHARQRRVFAPAFSNTALKKQEALVLGHVRKLVAHLERACASDAGGGGVKVNVADLFNFTTFDVMADLAFGAPLGLLDAGTYSLYVRNVFAVFRLLSLRAVVGFYLPWVYAFMMRRLSTKAVRERRSAHMNYGAELVDKRLDQAEGVEHADIWSFVERKQDVLTRSEMHINASVFMAAGTETTATALCGAVWYLTGNPEKMKKLVEEVRGEAGVEEFTMETLARLPYLNAVINESLRLYPPTPDMMYRLVPEGGAMICGTHVPAGAVVGLHQWPAYHSSKNFHRPEEFIPERWLTDAENSGEFAKDDKRVVQPFSRGPRSCIGKK